MSEKIECPLCAGDGKVSEADAVSFDDIVDANARYEAQSVLVPLNVGLDGVTQERLRMVADLDQIWSPGGDSLDAEKTNLFDLLKRFTLRVYRRETITPDDMQDVAAVLARAIGYIPLNPLGGEEE